MKHRFNTSIFMFILLLFLLSGCSARTRDPVPEEPAEVPLYDWGGISGETISIWGDPADLARPYMVRTFERYQELTGNTIVTINLSKQDINDKVPRAFASDSEERPDLLFSYGGTNVANLNPEENFYDFTNAPWVDDLTDTAINQSIYDGKVIGLPHGEASVSGTLYNKDIFNKFGIKPPETQEEFLAVCETLLRYGVTPVYLPYAEITMLLYQFPMDSFFTDRTILNRLNNGELTYAEIPEMKLIVEWYKTMSDRGFFGKDYQTNDWSGMDDAMKSGKYAMMLCWDTWLYTSFTGDTTKFGMMPAFMGTPEEGCFEGANIALMMANKKSPRLNAVLDLINFMADPCNYNIAFEGLYTAPVFKNQRGSVATPQYMEAERLITKLFYDSVVWSRIKGFSQIDAKYIQLYMQNECTLEECLRAMDISRLERAEAAAKKAFD